MTRAGSSIITPLVALAAGPAAWVIQLIVGYGLSSLACFPHDAPRKAPPASGEHILLAVLNLSCLAVALGGLTLALVAWRRGKPDRSDERNDLMPAGIGRAGFLDACGILSGAIFCTAILFDTAPILGAPACWSGLG
jgi:hypothetical protein